MDFLTLVQETHRESGSGGTAPTSLTGLRGENLRLKNWVARAYLEIQHRHSDWKYLWRQYQMPVIAGQALYAPLPSSGMALAPSSQIGEYDRGTFFLYGEAIGTVNYLEIKGTAPPTDTGNPHQVVIMPNDSLRLDVIPALDGILLFDYWATPNTLINNHDEPSIPARFHNVIVGKALTHYAKYENAPEIMTAGNEMYAEWMMALESDQLPGDRHMHKQAEGNDMVIGVE